MSRPSKETGDLELGPTTRQQTAMFDSMKLLMESMERQDAAVDRTKASWKKNKRDDD